MQYILSVDDCVTCDRHYTHMLYTLYSGYNINILSYH